MTICLKRKWWNKRIDNHRAAATGDTDKVCCSWTTSGNCFKLLNFQDTRVALRCVVSTDGDRPPSIAEAVFTAWRPTDYNHTFNSTLQDANPWRDYLIAMQAYGRFVKNLVVPGLFEQGNFHYTLKFERGFTVSSGIVRKTPYFSRQSMHRRNVVLRH